MKTQVFGPNLHHFLVLCSGLGDGVSREGENLVIYLNAINPFALFTGVLNSSGEDPLLPLGKVQSIIDGWCKLLGVETIVFRMDEGEYMQMEFEPEQIWMNLGKNAHNIVPAFNKVKWEILR